MTRFILFFSVFLCLSPLASMAEDFDPEQFKQQLEELDVGTLRMVAMQLRLRVEQQDAEIAQLKSAVANAAGGESATSPDGKWIVTVVSIPDRSAEILKLEADVHAMEKKLNGYMVKTQRISGVRDKLRRSQASYIEMRDAKDAAGKPAFSPQRISQVREHVASIKRDERTLVAKIARKKRDIESLERVRKFTGKTSDGIAVVVWARGVYADHADSIEVGVVYEITGSGKFSGDDGEISMKTATPVEDEDSAE